MSEPILSVRHLSKSFGDHRVLRDVDFDVCPGEVVCIIGASGSGKSTLLRCMNRLETPDGGSVEYRGETVGAPGFDEMVRGIRNAVDAGLIVSVNTPLCSLNRDYAATLRFAAALGVRYATCSGLIPSGGAEGAESRATRLSAEELTEILQSAVAAAHELSMELDFTSPGWLPEQTLRALGLHLIPSCGACLSNMAVAPDGTVIPCQSWLGGTALGNILTDDWPAIWDGEACRAIRAESAKMEHICQLQTGNRGKEGC